MGGRGDTKHFLEQEVTISYSHSEQIILFVFFYLFGGLVLFSNKKRLKIYRIFLKSETVREEGASMLCSLFISVCIFAVSLNLFQKA